MSVRASAPSDTFQIITVPLFDPDANKLPSGEKATLKTASLCPVSVRSSVPSNTLQILTVLSHDPDASIVPSDEKAILVIQDSVLINWFCETVSGS